MSLDGDTSAAQYVHIRLSDLVALCELEVRHKDEHEHLDLDDREFDADARLSAACARRSQRPWLS